MSEKTAKEGSLMHNATVYENNDETITVELSNGTSFTGSKEDAITAFEVFQDKMSQSYNANPRTLEAVKELLITLKETS